MHGLGGGRRSPVARTERSRVGHRRILKALEDGDPENARSTMLAHIEEVMEAFELLDLEE